MLNNDFNTPLTECPEVRQLRKDIGKDIDRLFYAKHIAPNKRTRGMIAIMNAKTAEQLESIKSQFDFSPIR